MNRKWLVWKGCFLLLIFSAACATTGTVQRKKEAEATRNLGEAYLAEGKFPAALKEFKKAEKLNSNDHFLHYDLGLLYFSKEKYDLAIRHFKKALEIKSDYAPAVNSLGSAYAGKKNWDKAIYYYQQVTEDLLYATPHFSLSNLGWAYYNKGEYKRSEKYYLEALDISPKFVMALQGLSQTYITMGRIPEAIEKLEKAVQLSPASARSHFLLAEAYRLSLEYKKAYREYQKVHELAPNMPLGDKARKTANEIRSYF